MFQKILILTFILFGCKTGIDVIEEDDALLSLGHLLFFDTRLSVNNTKSCSSCHNPDLAFTDGYRTSITSMGEHLQRNAPSLLNIDQFKFYNLADTTIRSLFLQHAKPLYSKHPIELGLHLDSANIFTGISKDRHYRPLLKQLNIERLNDFWLRTALSRYVRSLVTTKSAWDKYKVGDKKSLNKEQLQGLALFVSEKFRCAQCHKLPNFTSNTSTTDFSSIYHLIPLNPTDSGLYKITGRPEDIFKFRVSGLRNIALTAPYFHDGSAPDLSSVLKHYETHKTNYGIPNSETWTDNEKKAIIHFLHSLTDSSIFANPIFKNPFHATVP